MTNAKYKMGEWFVRIKIDLSVMYLKKIRNPPFRKSQ